MSPHVIHKSIEIGYLNLPSCDVLIIDCRSPEEYEQSHMQGSVNIPLQHLSVQKDTFPCSKEDTFYVYCRTGNRSATFVTYLRSIGYTNCQSIAEGYETWGSSGSSGCSG
jgi:rhodanese-related sulfurtransferase